MNTKVSTLSNILSKRDVDFDRSYDAIRAACNIFPKSTSTTSVSGQLALTCALRQMARSLELLARWSRIDPSHLDAIRTFQDHLEEIYQGFNHD